MGKIISIVPHFKQFGGVRRFLELIEPMKSLGVDYSIWVIDPTKDTGKWFGKDIPLAIDLNDYPFGLTMNGTRNELEFCSPMMDTLYLIGDPPSFGKIPRNGKTIVWVIAGGEYEKQYLDAYENRSPNMRFAVNNRALLKMFGSEASFVEVIEGGVDIENFQRLTNLHVGYYAGRGPIKGEDEIIAALSSLPGVTLVPLRGVENFNLQQFYAHLDYWVSWEKRPGWSNTAAEALSCGVTVLTNGINVEPFEDLCLKFDSIEDLRDFLLCPMRKFSWINTAKKVVEMAESMGWKR